MSVKNKVVVITGGAEGIGFEIAKNYLQNEAKVVVLLDINEQKGSQAIEQLTSEYGKDRACFFKCDITKDLEDVFNKVIHDFKTVHVLVNNAGTFNDALVTKTINVNVTALIMWSLKFWEHMRKDKDGAGGTIINLASIYGYRVDQFVPVYQASKFAVMGFTKSLGHTYNYNRSGVKVVAICPGFTETKLIENPKTWEGGVSKDFLEFVKIQAWQNVDVVGKAAIEIYGKPSGSAWLIEGGLPIREIILDNRAI
ncbi:hypothetical protein K1T71_007509 [Dendrolimus kikuchii]|uniref:Uncharacterized protein n=1 Tax=Dendrolimus kikuchii TaxID=765133 RepID=A0ACC1D184_9NEOP|nr:hypothetical protein K1T71_007509 [Dendrolimus kikuchii]